MTKPELFAYARTLPNLEVHTSGVFLEALNIQTQKAQAWLIDRQTNLRQVGRELELLND